jgi:stage V sporulation protein B
MAGLASSTAIVLVGQATFVLCGYLLHFVMSRAMDPSAYGIYGVMMNILVWTESALSNGVPWAVRKYLPEDPGHSHAILRAGLIWQMVVGVVLYAGTLLIAPLFTGAIRDPSLTFYVRLALTDIFWMALYTHYRGALNGFRMFAAQGAAMAAYAIGKLAFTLLLVRLGFSLTGALIGNVLGSIAGWLAGMALLRRRPRHEPGGQEDSARAARQYNGRTILGFALPTVLFTLAGTFLTTVGLVGVKALVADGDVVGYYAAANYLATAPNLLLVAFSMTLFPHLAGSVADRNWPLTSAYIRSAVRYLTLALLPGIALVLGASPRLMTIIYPRNYAVAAPLLNWLILSTALYSVYMVFANAILAEGRVLLALSIPSALVPVSLLATWYLIPRMGPLGAALAAVLSTGLAAIAAALYVERRFAVRLDWRSLLRTSCASLVLYGLIRLYLPRQALLLPYLALLGITYVILLCLLGELDVRALQRWVGGLWAAIGRRILGMRS